MNETIEVNQSEQEDKKLKTNQEPKKTLIQINNIEHYQDLFKIAEILSKSTVVGKSYMGSPSNCFVAMVKGHFLGLDPVSSLQEICVINGKPTLSIHVMLAIAERSGNIDNMEIVWSGSESDNSLVCKCIISRKNRGYSKEAEFGIQDAIKAKLITKDNWTGYQKVMLEHRATALALRKTFPDLFLSCYIKEELQEEDLGKSAVVKKSILQATGDSDLI